MKRLVCSCCGADEFIYKNGAKYCVYCNSRYEIEADEKPIISSSISLRSDIDILLEKCVTDPANAKRYANLVLDIDPTNRKALKYL